MPRLTDIHEIVARLHRERAWSVYGLADLASAMFAKTRWFTSDLALMVRDYGQTIAVNGGALFS